MAERNVCKEAFDKLCQDLNEAEESEEIKTSDYWLFELGFRSAIEELLTVADTGEQVKEFVSPRFQMLAERILQSHSQYKK